MVAILGLFAVRTALHPQFGVSSNIAFILADSVTIMIVATGQTIVVLGRGIDLSVSPVLGIAVVGIGFPAQDHNLNIWLALLFALLIGAGLGVGNGLLVSVIGIPPIIATLATLTIYGGWQFIICGDSSVVSVPATYSNFGNANLLPVVPWLLVIGVGAVAAAYLFLTRTVTGRSIYAVGNNADAAFRAGIPVPAHPVHDLRHLRVPGGAGGFHLPVPDRFSDFHYWDRQQHQPDVDSGNPDRRHDAGRRPGRAVGSALGAVFLSEALQAMISFRINELWDPAGVGVLILIAVVADRKGAPIRQLFRQPFRQPARALQ